MLLEELILNKLSFSTKIEEIKSSNLLWPMLLQMHDNNEEKALAYVNFINGEGLFTSSLKSKFSDPFENTTITSGDLKRIQKNPNLARMLFTFYCHPRYRSDAKIGETNQLVNVSLFSFIKMNPEFTKQPVDEITSFLENGDLDLKIVNNLPKDSNKCEIKGNTLFLSNNLSINDVNSLNNSIIKIVQNLATLCQGIVMDNINEVVDTYAIDLKNNFKKTSGGKIKNTCLYARWRVWKILSFLNLTIADLLEFCEMKPIDFEKCYKDHKTIFCIVKDAALIYKKGSMDLQTFQYYFNLYNDFDQDLEYDNEILETFNRRFKRETSVKDKNQKGSNNINKVGAF